MKKKQNSFIKILFVSVVFFIGWLMMIIIKEPVIHINGKAYKSVQHNGNIRKQ
jgi:hypothetical protein